MVLHCIPSSTAGVGAFPNLIFFLQHFSTRNRKPAGFRNASCLPTLTGSAAAVPAPACAWPFALEVGRAFLQPDLLGAMLRVYFGASLDEAIDPPRGPYWRFRPGGQDL